MVDHPYGFQTSIPLIGYLLSTRSISTMAGYQALKSSLGGMPSSHCHDPSPWCVVDPPAQNAGFSSPNQRSATKCHCTGPVSLAECLSGFAVHHEALGPSPFRPLRRLAMTASLPVLSMWLRARSNNSSWEMPVSSLNDRSCQEISLTWSINRCGRRSTFRSVDFEFTFEQHRLFEVYFGCCQYPDVWFPVCQYGGCGIDHIGR